jgi:hypothetical protein
LNQQQIFEMATGGPDTRNWQQRKQHPTQFGDAKGWPSGRYPKVLDAESLASFVDKHAIEVLKRTEQGREVLEAQGVPETPRQ